MAKIQIRLVIGNPLNLIYGSGCDDTILIMLRAANNCSSGSQQLFVGHRVKFRQPWAQKWLGGVPSVISPIEKRGGVHEQMQKVKKSKGQKVKKSKGQLVNSTNCACTCWPLCADAISLTDCCLSTYGLINFL